MLFCKNSTNYVFEIQKLKKKQFYLVEFIIKIPMNLFKMLFYKKVFTIIPKYQQFRHNIAQS